MESNALQSVSLSPLNGKKHHVGESAADTVDIAVKHAHALLSLMGVSCEDESTRDTPRRFVMALRELIWGTQQDPERHLAKTFPSEYREGEEGVISVAGVPIVSVCEHHMLPFSGRATVAYVPAPGARVVGLSKLARLVQEYAARPQMQERLGQQVISALTTNLATAGTACILTAAHACLTLRGAKAGSAHMTTTHFQGTFNTNPMLRNELLTLHRSSMSGTDGLP